MNSLIFFFTKQTVFLERIVMQSRKNVLCIEFRDGSSPPDSFIPSLRLYENKEGNSKNPLKITKNTYIVFFFF